MVAQALQEVMGGARSADRDGSFLCLSAGAAPENCTGLLRRFRPDLVLLVDAAEMGEAAGAVR